MASSAEAPSVREEPARRKSLQKGTTNRPTMAIDVPPDVPESAGKGDAGHEPSIPPLRADATPEEKDLHWFRHHYQGDKQKRLTLRAVLMGGVLGLFIAMSNLYTTLKLGWSFGVVVTACVLSF